MKAPEPTPRAYAVLLGVITLAGAYLRFRGVAWGLPDSAHPDYSYHPDEAFQLRCAAAMAEGVPVAAAFQYGGTLYISALRAYARLGAWLGGAYPLADTMLVGRCCTALMSTLALPLVAAIARRIGGMPAGLAAAAILAVAPAHVFLAVTVRLDEGAALLALGALYCALRLLQAEPERRRRWCVATGVALGALMAWRLPLGVFAVSALVATWFLHARPSGVRAVAGWLVCAEHLLIAVVAIVGYVLLSPHTLLYPELFREGMGDLIAIQSSVFDDAVDRGPALYQWGVTMLVEALGAGAYVLALLGTVLALRRRDPARLLVLAGALAYLALTPLASWIVVRFTLPIVAPLAALGALGLAELAAASRPAKALAAIALLLATVPAALADVAFLRALSGRDVRDLASDWLAAELEPGTSVVTFRRYEFDRSSNPVVPRGLVDSPFPMFTGIDPGQVGASPFGEVLVVNVEAYGNIERLGPSHPRVAMRKLGALLAPEGGYQLVTAFEAPVRFAGMDFASWFRSEDFRIMRPGLRIYRRRPTRSG